MSSTSQRLPIVRFVLLVLLMAVTRYHHFGSALQLPDASTAVFFLAGLYVSNVAALPALLLLAGLLDYLAIDVGGVSAWCLTPAYAFLIPTYAVLWYGGRWCRSHHRVDWSGAARLASALLIGTTLAFLISNAGFYAFSGYFAEMRAGDYAAAVVPYYPRYIGWMILYTVVAIGLQITWAKLRGAEPADAN